MKIKINVIETDNNQFFNCNYIVENMENNAAIIVDPAWNMEKYENIIKDHKLKPKGVLLTHSHIDHVDLVDYFIKKYNTMVYISEIESVSSGFYCDNMNLVNDNDIINIDGVAITCFLTPGHTKGSMIYEIGCNLFVGDTFFFEGCGTCNHSRKTAGDMFDSIQRIKHIFTDIYKVYPGHIYYKQPGQLLKDIKLNNFAFFLEKEEFIEYQMKKKLV